jgi:hypothetical protein
MRAIRSSAALVGLLAALTIPCTAAAEPLEEVRGEVVEVLQQTRNGGEFDALRIRTRQGEEMRLLLGDAGSAAGLQAGDRVRARLMAGDPWDQGYPVRSMRVRRTGQTLQFRDASGNPVRDRSHVRDRSRDGSGSGSSWQLRSRSRMHEPGTGACPRGATGRAGGGGRGGRG